MNDPVFYRELACPAKDCCTFRDTKRFDYSRRCGNLGHFDVADAQLDAAIIARRDRLHAAQVLLTKWAATVQKRMRQTMTQQQVADTLKLSRTAVGRKTGES